LSQQQTATPPSKHEIYNSAANAILGLNGGILSIGPEWFSGTIEGHWYLFFKNFDG